MKQNHTLDYLDQLEAESIHILREAAAQFERPGLLFSGGKDSICLVYLSMKAFRPGKFPFPFLRGNARAPPEISQSPVCGGVASV